MCFMMKLLDLIPSELAIKAPVQLEQMPECVWFFCISASRTSASITLIDRRLPFRLIRDGSLLLVRLLTWYYPVIDGGQRRSHDFDGLSSPKAKTAGREEKKNKSSKIGFGSPLLFPEKKKTSSREQKDLVLPFF